MSEVKVIDRMKALRLIADQVKKKGKDYVYKDEFKNCVYFDGRSDEEVAPRCIVGHVFSDLNIDFFNVVETDARDAIDKLNRNAEVNYRFTDVAILAFAAAQSVQDSGGTWGLAESVAGGIADTATGMGISDE